MQHRPPRSALRTARSSVLALSVLLALSACSSDDDDDPSTGTGAGTDPAFGTDNVTDLAFVAGAGPMFQSGQIERLSLGDEIVASGAYPATGSDIVVRTDGEDVYQIGRFTIDSLTRFSPLDLETPVYQYSVNGDETASNPYDIVFESEQRAYIVRYGSPTVWIVDPSAASEAEFKIGELDLTPYDADGVPEASDGLIVDGKLFVLMQRLTAFAPTQDSYVAVFDLATGTEIATGGGQDGLDGILLPVSNAESMQYVEATDEILVTGRGNLFGNASVTGDPYRGGLVSIDPDDYTTELFIDDGDADENQDFFAEALVLSPDVGYLFTYRVVTPDPFESETTLRRFDPRTGTIMPGTVAGLQGDDLSVLAVGPMARLWVGRTGDTPGFTIVDPITDTIVEPLVPTQFNPNSVVFIEAP